MTGRAATIHVNYTLSDGLHIFTNNAHGLYIVNKDAQRAYDDVTPALRRLLMLNYKVECIVTPVLTFAEWQREGGEPTWRLE
jgi:hypothetical protein